MRQVSFVYYPSTDETPTEASAPQGGSQFGSCPEPVGTPSPRRPRPRTSNLQSACRLTLASRSVYSQELGLPEGVEVIRVTPSAGQSGISLGSTLAR